MMKEDSLALETRRTIYDLIVRYPGLHEREIARRLDISLSTLDYHLHYMEKRGLVVARKDGRYTRYFAAKKVGMQDKKIISLMRQETPRQIVLFLLEHPGAIHKDICSAVGKSPSTVSFHLKKLAKAGIIEGVSLGRKTAYEVIDEEAVANALITYQDTFVDTAVDSFIDTWTALHPRSEEETED
ncbi:MAG: winged helix-turn-helix transcriptional regulator [Thermoplasmatota archaeon]